MIGEVRFRTLSRALRFEWSFNGDTTFAMFGIAGQRVTSSSQTVSDGLEGASIPARVRDLGQARVRPHFTTSGIQFGHLPSSG